jgi:hypothetical protein
MNEKGSNASNLLAKEAPPVVLAQEFHNVKLLRVHPVLFASSVRARESERGRHGPYGTKRRNSKKFDDKTSCTNLIFRPSLREPRADVEAAFTQEARGGGEVRQIFRAARIGRLKNKHFRSTFAHADIRLPHALEFLGALVHRIDRVHANVFRYGEELVLDVVHHLDQQQLEAYFGYRMVQGLPPAARGTTIWW